uniref:TIGR01777 family protein n=1 Tax=Desulfatirhabdium butyrativorans TaxID=340467 RepID=A0A7C4RHM2_9BACT
MHVVVCGGTGFVGKALVPLLIGQGHHVVSIGRRAGDAQSRHERLTLLSADTTTEGPWQETIRKADVVVNLAGTSIFTRWTDRAKQSMVNSRIQTTRAIANAIEKPDTVLINTSAVGYYGDRGDDVLDESASAGTDFLAELAVKWEEEAFRASSKGNRVVAARFGVVLGKDGGALEQMLTPFRFFVGGPLGNGRQWFSWIHMQDLIRAVLFCIETDTIQGPVNFVSPQPCTNRELVRTIGRILNRPSWMPAPAFALRLILGEFASVLLASQRAMPKRLLENGFLHHFPTIASALENLLHARSTTL